MTNEQTLGVNSSAEGELCNIVNVQTNASVDFSETSTKLLEWRLILTRSSFTGLDPLSCRLVSLLSRVDCFCPSSLANWSLLSPFVSLSDWRPLTTSGHVEISSPKPFVWFRAKTDKGIVCLAGHLHCVTRERPTNWAEGTASYALQIRIEP